MIVRLVTVQQDDYATAGVLIVGDIYRSPRYVTLELPWRDNRHDVSCIPAGVYACAKGMSPARGIVVPWVGVAGRGAVQMHVANWPEQLRGCIAIGYDFTIIDSRRAIGRSKLAFDSFMTLVPDTFTLKVER